MRVDLEISMPSTPARRASGPSGQGQRDRLQQTPQSGGAAGVQLRDPRYLLGEGDRRAVRVSAEETARFELDRHRAVVAGQIVQAAPVTAVNARGRHSTTSAGRLRTQGPRDDQHTLALIGDLFDVHVLEMWQEQIEKIKAAGFHARRMVQHNSPRGRSLMIRFLVEPDHYGAAAPMRAQLPNRDHPQALALNTVSHGFTISVPEPR
jgi:hypothetical protein